MKIHRHPYKLEIERGRYNKTARNDRICRLCPVNEIGNEEHFLMTCTLYDYLREKHSLTGMNSITEIMGDTDPERLGKYLSEAFEIRQERLEQLNI